MKELTLEQIAAINRPLPKDAVKDNPAKRGFSAIKVIYVTERLNEVFGIGKWQIRSEVIPFGNMPVLSETKTSAQQREYTTHFGLTKTTLSVPEYGIHYEVTAGSQNEDIGDSLKGSQSDAISKIASYIGIGMAVFKGQHNQASAAYEKEQATELNKLVKDAIIELSTCNTVDALKELKSKLPASVVGHAEFTSAATARYNQVK